MLRREVSHGPRWTTNWPLTGGTQATQITFARGVVFGEGTTRGVPSRGALAGVEVIIRTPYRKQGRFGEPPPLVAMSSHRDVACRRQSS